ncbi:MAG: hypothetical protein ACU83V_14910 [Gammaproteobacteria bacterium]
MIDSIFYYKAEVGGDTEIAHENHSLENIQVILLLTSGLAYLRTVFYIPKDHRLLPWVGALLCFSFILRELDVEKFDLPQVIIFLGGHGYGRNIMLISLWLWAAVLFFRNPRHYWSLAMHILPIRSCLFVILGGVLLVVGSLFESQVFGVKSYQLYEELSEMNGYAFILFASLNLLDDLQYIRNQQSTVAFIR